MGQLVHIVQEAEDTGSEVVGVYGHKAAAIAHGLRIANSPAGMDGIVETWTVDGEHGERIASETFSAPERKHGVPYRAIPS